MATEFDLTLNRAAWPLPLGNASSASAWGIHTMDASGEKGGYVIMCPKDGQIASVAFCLGTVSNVPDNGIRVSLQDLNSTTGLPDGVMDQYRDVTSGLTTGSIVETGKITSDGTDTGTMRTVIKGQQIAVMIDFVNFVAGDNMQIRLYQNGPWGYAAGGRVWEYCPVFTTLWSKLDNDPRSLLIKYSGDSLYTPHYNSHLFNTGVTTSYSSASTPNEYGMKFTAPFNMKTSSVCWSGQHGAASSGYRVSLYNSSDVLLASFTDPGPNYQVVAGQQAGTRWGWWNTPVSLTGGQVYRVTVLATTATAQSYVYGYSTSATFIPYTPWRVADATAVHTYRKNVGDSGAWTDGDGTVVYGICLR